MKNVMNTKPCSDVINRAILLIIQQEKTPESPGAMTDDGQVTYCAAAALAVASLQLKEMPNRFEEFSDKIRASEYADRIREVFTEQGWSLSFCNEVMMLNDSFAPNERSRKVIGYLRSIDK